MLHGDLDNTPVPRVYVVFEGTLAHPSEKRRIFKPRLKDYALDIDVSQLIWDKWQRLGVRFDAVTFDFRAEDVQSFLDQHPSPIHTTWAFATREVLIKEMPYMPWVSTIVDHARPMAYGARGLSLQAVR